MKVREVVLITLLFTSCGDVVRFEEPQPRGKSDEKAINKKFIGEYLSLNDSSKLRITSALVVRYSTIEFREKLDSTDRIEMKADTAYSGIENNMQFDIVVEGDSTFQQWRYYDTLFDASKQDILRKYKGYYFLNTHFSFNSWRVTTMMRKHDAVILGAISKVGDIDNLRGLTDTKSDSVFKFQPTRKELKKFLKANGFSDENTFVRIN